MENVKNIILKQNVEFSFNGRADGIALQQEVHEWCTQSLLPEIEKQLDLLVSPDQYLVIDTLEIDALINRKDWKQELRYILMHQFTEKVKEQTAISHHGKKQGQSLQQRTDDLVLFYIDKGYLPWWGDSIIVKDFGETLRNWLAEIKSEARVKYLVEQLQKIFFSKVQHRLLSATSWDLFFQFSGNLFKTEQEKLERAQQFFKCALSSTTAKKISLVRQAVMQSIFSALLEQRKIDDNKLISVFHAALKKEGLLKKVSTTLSGTRDFGESELLSHWKKIVVAETKLPQKQPEKKLTPGVKGENDHDEMNVTLVNTDRLEEIPAEGIFIENAGLVVLAAYIPMLFSNLRISGEGELSNPFLATCLLQHLVTGKDKFMEYELLLPKILCGVPTEELVDTNQQISDLQKAEAHELLLAVIEHWQAIKGTSVQGLRESFLQRSGKLIFVENEFHLSVERKAYDMLMNSIPWNISMIKLPWMKQLLRTQWIS